MPAKSVKQRRFMAMCEHGKATKSKCPNMSKSQMHDLSATKEKGLPMKKKSKTKKKTRKSEWSKLKY